MLHNPQGLNPFIDANKVQNVSYKEWTRNILSPQSVINLEKQNLSKIPIFRQEDKPDPPKPKRSSSQKVGQSKPPVPPFYKSYKDS